MKHKGMKRIYRYMKCQFVGTWRAMFATFAIGSWQLAAIGSILLATTACTDDVNVNGGIIATDGETGITLYLPDIEGAAEFGATRVDDPVDQKTIEVGTGEAALKDMYLLAFDKSNGSRKIFPLYTEGQDNADYKPNSSNGYKTYTIKINEGTYKFYLLANLDEYLEGKVDGLSNEDKVLEAVLKFADKVPGTLKPGNLPMACLASQMKNAPGANEGSASEGTVTIVAGKNNAVYADMYFLCSKVRYTILFDQDSFSNQFTTTDVDFKAMGIADMRTNAVIDPDFETKQGFDPSYSSIPAYSSENVAVFTPGAVAYPASDSKYFGNRNYDENFPEDLGEQDWNDDSSKKAWQGTVYLPANLSSEKPTTLNFTAKGSQMHEGEPYSLPLYWKHDNDSEEAHGLDRSNFYDIIIKLTKPESINKEENITVNVKDWNPQELAYSLHGPFELVVDKTTIDVLQSGYWSPLFYISDAENVSIDSPTIKYSVNDKTFEVPFYKFQKVMPGDSDITDDDGNPYEFGDWPSMIRVSVNDVIPYSVMRKLNTGQKTDDGKSLDDLKYFHIVAANLHKRINVELLEVGAYLTVSPLKIEIDARQYYTSGIERVVFDPNKDYSEDQLKQFIKINFQTNFDSSDSDITFTLSDPKGLLNGRGNYSSSDGDSDFAMILQDHDGVLDDNNNNVYTISKSTGDLYLDLKGLTGEASYWKEAHQYTLTFTLTLPIDANGKRRDPIIRTVIITVKPFTTNYTIHFYDNTKEWDDPHIYVYQLLTLPANMPKEEGNPASGLSQLAGQIVGFVSKPTSGESSWNVAAQYVFTNNLSFRGWKGFGGPDINNPYENTVHFDPNNLDATKGYVLFGDPDGSVENNQFTWNYSYCYNWENNTNENADRYNRYNYDVNFNHDHVMYSSDFKCQYCALMANNNENFNTDTWSKYSSDNKGNRNRYFYPGIAMKPDQDNPGWYVYTLTGVAQPGETVIIFANGHVPWEQEGKTYGTEDLRYPTDYEPGLPLFDYADNDGWFVFNGNSSVKNQPFYDNYEDIPLVIPHKFTSDIVKDMIITVRKPANGTVSKIEVNGQTYSNSSENGNNLSFEVKDTSLTDRETFEVKIYTDEWNYKTYTLYPKNFRLRNNIYQLRDPLYLEYTQGMKFFVKWSDQISIDQGWDEHYSYYQPSGSGGSDSFSISFDNNLSSSYTPYSYDEIVGNYKIKEFTMPEVDPGKSTLYIKLDTKNNGYDHNYQKIDVQDLPKYYNPSSSLGYYQINWHMLKHPY